MNLSADQLDELQEEIEDFILSKTEDLSSKDVHDLLKGVQEFIDDQIDRLDDEEEKAELEESDDEPDNDPEVSDDEWDFK